MRITEAGNVGIGTNDPKTTLHVNRDFQLLIVLRGMVPQERDCI